jgi:adenylate cyclase
MTDRELADFLREDPGYRVRPLRRVAVRGYDDLQPWLVRRRATGHDADPHDHEYDDEVATPELG